MVKAKSDLSKQIAETAKKCLGVNSAGKDVFELIISRPAPPPTAPFVFSTTLVEKKKAPLLKASTVLNKAVPKSPISQAILDLIKEKRRLRRLYNNTQDSNIKSTINKLQKEIRTKINQESTISWEKFSNSISLESDPKKSWRKITNLIKPKGPP